MFSLLKENTKIALDSIRSQLLRTILTVVIITIGITALVGILSAISALENTIAGNFASMGANTFNLQRYDFSLNSRGRGQREKVNPIISYRDAKEFKEKFQFPYSKTSISFTGTANAEIKYQDKKTDPEARVLGVNENFMDNSGLELQSGRNFSIFDIENNNAVCVLGSDFKKALFDNLDPVNKTISVRGAKFKVIGVLESKGSTFGNNEDLRVFIPIQTARSLFNQNASNYNISVKVDDKQFMEGAQDEATLTFRSIRKLKPKEDNNFAIERSDSLLNQIFEITGYLNVAAWAISIITILGSSIALMNIMLVSVTERTREIGIRKALGAKRKTIAFQFFSETMIIGQLGGLFGIIFGMLIGMLFASLLDFDFVIPWIAIFSAVAISFTIAVLSGLFPAIKAAKQDPIESLRYE